ncbi:MAG: hypothetical protein C0518_08000 [Opitutus sp.]|nr:hypothetical protein [Opitutus sp.]
MVVSFARPPNGTASGYLYDAAGRLKTIDTYRVAGQVNILRQDFGYDSRDRRTWSLRDSSHGDSYTYQADSQLTGFRFNQLRPDQNPNGSAASVDTYAYDPNGNRTTRDESGAVTTYSANALNEYATVSNGTIAHDNRGNVSLWQDWSYTYDAENRLISAVRTGLTVAFFYDAQGRLAKLTRNGTPEYRFFDGTRLFLRKNDAGAVVERTIWGPTANEALARWTPTQADGWRYYHHDPQNSPLALTDGAGLVFERYLYDAFGQDYVFDGTWTGRADSSVGNPWRFTGQEWMADLALHNFKARFYHHDLGRFLQQDPLRFDAGDLNLYRYAGNNTLNRVDPNGLTAKRNPSAINFTVSVSFDAPEKNAEKKKEAPPPQDDAKKVEEQKAGQDPNSGVTYGGPGMTEGGVTVLAPFQVTATRERSGLDRLQTGLDVAGVFDPTPLSDGVNAVIYAGRGQWGNALIAVAGIVPYVGDLAKGGKYGAKAFKAGNKIANKQVGAVANEFGIARREFSEFVHEAKRMEGRGGADNFTYEELRQLAQEFLEHRPKG